MTYRSNGVVVTFRSRRRLASVGPPANALCPMRYTEEGGNSDAEAIFYFLRLRYFVVNDNVSRKWF